MAIEYINKQGATVASAAEKIKVVSQERRMRTNPFIGARAIAEPNMSEAFNTGGGVYRFEQLIGMEAATRRTSAPTDSTITFGNNITLEPIVLTVSQPLEVKDGKGVPTSRSDVAQLDGMDFTPVAATKTANILIDGETKADVTVLTDETKKRKINGDGTAKGFRAAVHKATADYFDISAENTNWTDANVLNYFDAKNYSYDREEILVYMNPVDTSDVALALNDAGVSTGDLAFKRSEDGKFRTVNGINIIETRYVPKGKAIITPKGTIGAPDPEVINTMIKTSETFKGDLVTYGKHYYDSVQLFPELVTIVEFASAKKAQA